MSTQSQLLDRVATRIQGLILWILKMKLYKIMKITGLTFVVNYYLDQAFFVKLIEFVIQ